ncbi:DEAD/DEAH box helicase [Methanococcoides orientis]|uniref:DEAD/DEAH box helicase n=1 Tax=Methanococcoides orientis TaxID=2822137 RepID=UPI001E4F10CB|nr:DEAD/DEAH box helicase [Methanococcoides orientis]UGV41417.1 DEAD/DEAH box helicase [Methanococcoides orientis]
MNATLIDKLTEDVLGDQYFKELFIKASSSLSAELFQLPTRDVELTEKEYVHLLRFADILSNSSDSKARNKSYQIISILNHAYKEDPTYRTYSKAVFAKLGNFPAIEYLEKKDRNPAKLPFDRNLEKTAKEIIQSVPDSEGLVFTDVQYELFTKLKNSKLFSFSGPTSMGKSFIIKSFIREVLGNTPKENLVIMVPTRALINQFTLDLKSELGNYIEEYGYKIVTNSNVSELLEDNSNYVFILTPERLLSYLSKKDNPSLGFIFVDEAHKIASQKDLRSVTAYKAIEKTLQTFTNINLYFASPNVSNPEIFLKVFNKNPSKNFHTIESPVSQNLFFINMLEFSVSHYIDDSIKTFHPKLLTDLYETNNLIKHLGKNDYNIVYCNSKNTTIEKSFSFANIISKENFVISQETKKAIKQIQDYIHEDFYLASFLEVGIAYHFGSLPQLVRNIVENLYRDGHIKYLFCTSTLLEGVNLPTKNVFILVNKNGRSQFTDIDFWNLAGRAGRLKKELSGNIYCIRDDIKNWKNTEVLEQKNDIKLKPTIEEKTDTEKELMKIEKTLLNEDIKGTLTEKEILEYIANIICIDTLKIDSGYQSPVIQKLIEMNKSEIISIAHKKAGKLKVPLEVLNSNQSIDIEIQNKVYNFILKRKNTSSVLLPQKVDYSNCLKVLSKFYDNYEWDKKEKNLKNKNSLSYFALLMNQWINGTSLNQIIKDSIDYHVTNKKHIYIAHKDAGEFNKNNKEHINALIGSIIEDIEGTLRYSFEKYFTHYYMSLVEVFGEENAGVNWSQFLEYGTQNRLSIALQNLGVSRHTANYILQKHKNVLIIEDNKLKGINKNKLFADMKKTNIEYEEIKSIFG